MSAVGTVYMIRHNITGRMYIGRTENVNKRVYQHFCLLKRGKHSVEDMQSDFDAYGDNFTISVLGYENYSNRGFETQMMDKYKSTTRGVGYNYKDPHITAKKRETVKSKLHKLVDALDEKQVAYSYTLLSKLFGDKNDEDNA